MFDVINECLNVVVLCLFSFLMLVECFKFVLVVFFEVDVFVEV